MNNEIKEILENIKTKYNDYYVQDIVSGKDLKILLDYINHLERINEKLKSYIKLTDEEAKEYMYDTNKEIDRLNNIINEFDKWLIGEQMMFYKSDYGERQQQVIKYLENINKELYDAIIEYLSNTIHIDKETCIQVFEDNINSWSEAVIYHCLLDLDKIKKREGK